MVVVVVVVDFPEEVFVIATLESPFQFVRSQVVVPDHDAHHRDALVTGFDTLQANPQNFHRTLLGGHGWGTLAALDVHVPDDQQAPATARCLDIVLSDH